MKHLMVDLETLGTVPGCVILSVGAVFFDPVKLELGDEFYKVIHTRSCEEAGLHTDPDTVAWWNKQSAAANQVRTDAMLDGQSSLKSVLEEFNAFIKRDTGVKVWGNGADFDNPILVCAYKAVGTKQGWLPYNGRCYRTFKNMFKDTKMDERVGTFHNALDDAKNQALHMLKILEANEGVTIA
jgi:DNA polymerase III epsilon subunit-like protein